MEVWKGTSLGRQIMCFLRRKTGVALYSVKDVWISSLPLTLVLCVCVYGLDIGIPAVTAFYLLLRLCDSAH